MPSKLPELVTKAIQIRQKLEQLFSACAGNSLDSKITNSNAPKQDVSTYHEIRIWANRIIHGDKDVDLRKERPKAKQYTEFLSYKRAFCK
ncbi:hypothetical protein P9112_003460 [Eukaryota sp. TZLM1-RC]